MPFEDLIEAVRESAEEKIREIRERARIEADEILAEARSKEGSIKQQDLVTAKQTLELDKMRQIAALREDAKMHLAKKKDELYQRSFREAEEKLDTMRRDPSYSTVFRRLLEEALEQKQEGEGITLHIDPRDEIICKHALEELNINSQVISDLKSMGGMVIASADQSTSILNTFESRMIMAREQLRAEVFSILFGA
jgi:vacuolar-type H+-ATPase subunit E/Vma4